MNDVVAIVLLVWVVWYAWRGYRKGVWVALLGLVSLIFAYLGSYLWGPSLASIFVQYDVIASSYATYFAYLVLFVGIGSVVRFLPLILFPALHQRSLASKISGALVGTGVGVVTGLMLVWAVSFLARASALKADNSAVTLSTGPVQDVAEELVARLAEKSVQLTRGEALQSKLVVAFIREPEATLKNVQQLVRAPSLNRLVNSPRAQKMMATNDIGNLANSHEFEVFLREPALQNMLELLDVESKNSSEAEQFIAQQLTLVWQRKQYLKNDPRVKSILADPELQRLFQQRDSVQLLKNSQFRRLVSIILEEKAEINGADLSQYIDVQPEDASASVERVSDAVKKNDRREKIYKWRDQSGTIRYTDVDSIPADKFSEAELIVQ